MSDGETLSQKSVDSDCQILEPERVLIEISDVDNDNDSDHQETKPSIDELNQAFSGNKIISVISLNQDKCPETPILQGSGIMSNEERLSRISVDSECQILELVESVQSKINDVDNDNDVPITEPTDDQLSQSSTDTDSKSISSNQETFSNEDKQNENISLNSDVFRIIFSSRDKYVNLKDTIISSLKLSFEEKNLNIELSDDAIFLEISGKAGSIITEEQNSLLENSTNLITTDSEICSSIPCKRSLDLGGETSPKNKKTGKESSKKILCFNCNGEHEFKNCSLPANSIKIDKKRRKLYYKSAKYHNKMEEKFGCLKPGKLSKNLRNALGLTNGELPSFFYRMRALGYPPGWLENAKQKYSETALMNCDGLNVLNPADEEGEHSYYNVKKIIGFPGFNVYPSGEYFDDYQSHGVPPIDGRQSKNLFIYKLGEKNVQEIYNRTKTFESLKASETIKS